MTQSFPFFHLKPKASSLLHNKTELRQHFEDLKQTYLLMQGVTRTMRGQQNGGAYPSRLGTFPQYKTT